MPDIQLSENGILKLLKDLNPHKAAGWTEAICAKGTRGNCPHVESNFSKVHWGW